MFDLTVPGPGDLLITDLDVNINSVTPVGTAFSLDIYTRSGTAVGFAENGGTGWTLATSGTGVSAAEGSPSPVNLLDSLVLAPGVTGIAIDYNNAAPAYFTGSLTFGNADLSLTGYAATANESGLFTGLIFRPTHLERHDYVSDGHGASPRTRSADPARPRSQPRRHGRTPLAPAQGVVRRTKGGLVHR